MSSSDLRKIIYGVGSQLKRSYKVSARKRMINDSYENNFEPYSEYIIEDFEYDPMDNYLSFEIVRYTYKPKIERYVTNNYVKYPIYSEYPSIKTKIMKKFSKAINLENFCESQILKERFSDDSDSDVEIRKGICELLEYEPRWLRILNEINELKDGIEKLKVEYKEFIPTQYSYRPKLKETPSNLFLRIFFLPFTLGLSFIGFISKKRAEINKNKNLEIDKWNEEHKKNIDLFNKKEGNKVANHNNKINDKIKLALRKIDKLEFDKNNYKPKTTSDGWIDIKESFLYENNDLKNAKGIYIIWNKNNNKYYVGQTKNLYNRIFMQHFDSKNQRPKNYLFF